MSHEKRVLILQHIQENPPGLIGDILHMHNIAYDVAHVTKQSLPDPTEYDAVVVVGGSQHVYDEDKKPYGMHEEELICTTLEQDACGKFLHLFSVRLCLLLL